MAMAPTPRALLYPGALQLLIRQVERTADRKAGDL